MIKAKLYLKAQAEVIQNLKPYNKDIYTYTTSPLLL